MEWWHVYLWTRLDTAYEIFKWFSILSMIGFVICTVLSLICDPKLEAQELANCKRGRNIFSIGWLFLFLFMLTPTSKDFALIYILPTIVESKVIQEDIPEVYNMGLDRLKEMMGVKEEHKCQQSD